MTQGVHAYLEAVRRECAEIHSAVPDIYFDYPIEAELAS